MMALIKLLYNCMDISTYNIIIVIDLQVCFFITFNFDFTIFFERRAIPIMVKLIILEVPAWCRFTMILYKK